MKLLKCRKGLSPVVAAIILIAVTVAVSIAVASWMGSLTIGFMETEELQITSMTFTGTGASITLSVQNIGTGKVTIASARVNGVEVDTITGDLSYEAGEINTEPIVLTHNWAAGSKYKVVLISSTGTLVATYEKTA